jgi:hypothetical protein
MHVERHRPSAPAIDVHVGGSPSPAVWMTVSGAQKPGPASVVQVARSDCSAAGTRELETQWAPAHAGEHCGNVLGSMMGGPVYGHAIPDASGWAASKEPASLAHDIGWISQAPVDMPFRGLMHGAHSSSASQVPWLRSGVAGFVSTAPRHLLRQTPEDPPIDAHDLGEYEEPAVMIFAGTHTPALPDESEQVAKFASSLFSTSYPGRQ